eukprot:13155820-Alexandrium_andersonii.AAC.1
MRAPSAIAACSPSVRQRGSQGGGCRSSSGSGRVPWAGRSTSVASEAVAFSVLCSGRLSPASPGASAAVLAGASSGFTSSA